MEMIDELIQKTRGILNGCESGVLTRAVYRQRLCVNPEHTARPRGLNCYLCRAVPSNLQLNLSSRLH